MKFTKVSDNLNIEKILQGCCLTTLDGSKEVHAPIEDVKLDIIKFGRKLLELAAENAIAEEIGGIDIPKRLHVNKQSIYNTIKQVE